jgi:hypothetical protein
LNREREDKNEQSTQRPVRACANDGRLGARL